MSIVPVIISGGAGSRLWPLSRESHPKPLIDVGDGQSLLQHAFRRALAMPDVVELVTVTNRDLLFVSEDEYRDTGLAAPPLTYVLEPEGRETAAAIAAATLAVEEAHGRDAILCVLPADHMVAKVPAFIAAVEQAIVLARQGRLVTFGIKPTRPETGYGYIEANGTDVVRFVEKPDTKTAEGYVASGRFFWNAGMFCFAAGTMLDLLEQFGPDILQGCRDSLEAARRSSGKGVVQIELDKARFSVVRKESIDYAVLEKAPNVSVVPCDIGWSDIGSWTAFADLIPADAAGNHTTGEVALVDTKNSIISGGDRLIGAVGVEDMIIVDTADALLVARREDAQKVKTLFNRLKAEGHEASKLHRTVHRPWGTYTVLEEGERFKIKRIEVKPGGRLSLQMHHHRSEHWVVVSGTARVVNGETEMLLATNQSTYIPSGTKHRLENPGILRLVMIEVQTGDYLGEDDIVRYDDVYGRN
ncbi:mannose-1-phosphate guanylyltransferase/mannose-6-phosphate isomerase [Mesorhizobium sp. LHD-90]|uniref:mannose-1-phosphate guanylyltransferase/mannose-6-phosphate isomerase n=1 Tax=Mesorhizobium sp. LHD-90 TaxID=3071414 RepID=UPI0027E0D86C|nr:mannose-1-phosphate guanylyltransferase/mannose-6-phosphate isomerase [Mesorhizobium sp. LHD-90]MDQ6434983.1 mannose-1-phosphate guanylyltransferase/mannose-6-phosphate isomerase [Mesorhizobium sp. LHD-90]